MIFKKNNPFQITAIIVFSLLGLYLLSGCEKEVSTSPPDDEIPKAFLNVQSYPTGFSIFLNGKNTGRITPDYVPYLEEGLYNITLKKKYFRDTTFSVTLTNLDTSNIFIDLFQNPLMLGKINFSSSPVNAEIILNDSVTGLITPAMLTKLRPGLYSVRYKLYNYRDANVNIIVESNKTTTVYEQLRDTSDWIDYQINNSNIQSNLLTSIAIDHNNSKWIGTSDLGIISFNEIDFVNFNSNNSSIPSNQINCISISDNNNIWVGTNNGLAIFNGISWQVFNVQNSGLLNDNINAITFDQAGNAWIGTNNGFVKFDGITWEQFNYTSPQFTYLWVTGLQFDNSNNLWIGSNNFGILNFNGNTFSEFVDTAYNFLTNKIISIALDNSNKLWFGQLVNSGIRGGLSVYDGFSFTNFYLGTLNNKINSIYTSNNNKWVCTSEGLTKYDAGNSSIFFSTLNSYLTNDNVTDAARDSNGNLWITTIGGGLNKLKNQ